jgi:uncharacterized protein (TIGR03382 family)
MKAALVLLVVSGVAVAAPSLAVDVSADRHPISDDIYGMNFADPALAAELRLPVNRWGGNATSRYNWQVNVGNAGSDYYFIIQDLSSSTTPGAAADGFVDQDRLTGTKTLLTIPVIPYITRGRPPAVPAACNYSLPPFSTGQFVSRYGESPTISYGGSTCGNGWGGSALLPLSSTQRDALHIANTPQVAKDWITHLVARYGTASAGGVGLYMLDNEPSLWESTHGDIYLRGALSYAALRDLSVPYARAVKDADPGALVLGPADWGYLAYFDSPSAFDGNGGGAAANGNTFFGVWYLQQMKAYQDANGIRILDYFDEHYYPQVPNGQPQVALQNDDGNAATRNRRLQSVRSLWDPTYSDDSWIADLGPAYPKQIRLIRLFREWVAANYPGTRVSISEYNFGALDSINGALAQADVLGVFGREQLDLATIWAPPGVSQPGAYAFRIYRNYDGAGARFGDVSVQATSSDQTQLGIYAAQRSADSAVTVVVINKTGGDLSSPLGLASLSTSSAQRFQYGPGSLGTVQALADVPISGGVLSATYPGNSITLWVLSTSGMPLPDAGTPDAGGGGGGGGGGGDAGSGAGGVGNGSGGVIGSCSTGTGGPALAGLALVLLGVLVRRRSRVSRPIAPGGPFWARPLGAPGRSFGPGGHPACPPPRNC